MGRWYPPTNLHSVKRLTFTGAQLRCGPRQPPRTFAVETAATDTRSDSGIFPVGANSFANTAGIDVRNHRDHSRLKPLHNHTWALTPACLSELIREHGVSRENRH